MRKVCNKKKIVLLLALLLFFLFFFLIYSYVKYEVMYEPYYIFESRLENISNTKVKEESAYAWIRVQGTNIDLPIVPRTSSLEGDFQANYAWTSSNYVDGENRKVIYGHNIRNVSFEFDVVNPNHYRFEQLMSFLDYDFASKNLYIQYSDGINENLYKIYAVTFNDEKNENGSSYKSGEVENYIKEVRASSIYDYSVRVNEKDELISLVTCTRFFGISDKTQFKIDARKVRKSEKINKYKVETNSNYDIIK